MNVCTFLCFASFACLYLLAWLVLKCTNELVSHAHSFTLGAYFSGRYLCGFFPSLSFVRSFKAIHLKCAHNFINRQIYVYAYALKLVYHYLAHSVCYALCARLNIKMKKKDTYVLSAAVDTALLLLVLYIQRIWFLHIYVYTNVLCSVLTHIFDH